MGFLAEIKERRIFQIVAGYAAAGWIILEGVAQFADRGILPEVAYRVGIIWYLGGLTVASITGWYHGEKGAQRFGRLELTFLSGVGVLVLAGSGLTLQHDFTSARISEARGAVDDAALRRVAVLYFDEEGGEERYLGDALTEALIQRLELVPALDVVSRNGVRPFRGSDAPYDSIAAVLGAGTLVTGSVEASDRRLRVSLHLVDGATGIEISRSGLERRPEDVMAAMADVADEAAALLREALGQEVRLREISAGTDDIDTWRVFQQGEVLQKDAEEALTAGDREGWARMMVRSDSLLALAEALDPGWVEPSLARAEVAFQRGQRTADAELRAQILDGGDARVQRVLDRQPNNARALEMRGSLAYVRYLTRMGRSAREQEELLRRAREALEQATGLDPSLASAQATLSHLYYQPGIGDVPAAALAARSAYEADAYLRNADDILDRLFLTNLDMGQFRQADAWCQEGQRRFPRDPRFAICQLWLMTSPGAAPEPDEAWALHEEYVSRSPEARREIESTRSRFLVAGALARAGGSGGAGGTLADSARSVLEDAHARYVATGDPGSPLLGIEAFIWTLVGDEDRAIDLLKMFAANNHGFQQGGDLSWRWASLRGHPRFQEIVTQRGVH